MNLYSKIILLFLLQINFLFGVGFFKLNNIYGRVTIKVNRVDYLIDSNYVTIKTNYPNLDTINYLDQTINGNNNSFIICNFKPNSSYSIIPACCATYDIVQSFKYYLHKDSVNFWIKNDEIDKIQNLLLDKPTFTFKVQNVTKKDRIYAWYEDYACFPTYKSVNKKGWDYGFALKCYFWTNFSTFTFFTINDTIEENKIIEDFPSDNIQKLASLTIRFFDNNHYDLIYDNVKKKIIVKSTREKFKRKTSLK